MVALKAKHPKKAAPKKPKILIYGKPGAGKTWGALDFPSVYYVDCEGGAALGHYTDKLVKSGGVYLGPEDGANDMNVVVQQVMALATTKHEYRTLVIDSYSKLYNTATQIEYDRMQQAGRDMDKTFGAEKKPAIAGTRQLVRWFEKLDMNVILVCHERNLWKDGKEAGETFDGYEKLEYELDLVLQIFKQGNSRKARVGKNRLEQFREGEVMDWGFTPFAERYGMEIITANSTPIEPATAEQIRVVQELAGLFKLPDDERLKWFEKAGVNAWGEMDATTIQKCIDHFQKSLNPAVA